MQALINDVDGARQSTSTNCEVRSLKRPPSQLQTASLLCFLIPPEKALATGKLCAPPLPKKDPYVMTLVGMVGMDRLSRGDANILSKIGTPPKAANEVSLLDFWSRRTVPSIHQMFQEVTAAKQPIHRILALERTSCDQGNTYL